MRVAACLALFINLYKSITNQFLLLNSFLLQHLWRKLGEQSLLGITADRMPPALLALAHTLNLVLVSL
jgi:hypothetical protein